MKQDNQERYNLVDKILMDFKYNSEETLFKKYMENEMELTVIAEWLNIPMPDKTMKARKHFVQLVKEKVK